MITQKASKCIRIRLQVTGQHLQANRCGDQGGLTITHVVYDPVILTEPLVRSQSWFLDPGQRAGLFPCEYLPEVPAEAGTVPHYLPGTNPWLKEFAEWYALPFEAIRGGAETLYPEYRAKMGAYKPKDKCERFCNCTGFGDCLSPTGGR